MMMRKYFLLLFHFFALLFATNAIDHNPILDPVELVLRSSDTEGFFYCNGHVDLNTQKAKLVASFANPNLIPPTLLHQTEQINSTTIRIQIKPNGHIGANRLHCHWDNNQTFGSIADLIIGEPPGVIILKKEHCLAFDRRYVQCTFTAATIGRALKNGFPKLFSFMELNRKGSPSYHSTPELVEITEDNELVFQFQPIDRFDFPRRSYMGVNITLKKFGSTYYKFAIEPLHTTKVSFQLEEISSRELTININHNNSGTISPRLCSGHLSQIDKEQTWTAVQDITATADLKIAIKGLRPSTEYEVCLKCYYDLEDESYKSEICQRNTTPSSPIRYVILAAVASVGVILVISGMALYHQKNRIKICLRKSDGTPKIGRRKPSFPPQTGNPPNHYDSDPTFQPLDERESLTFIKDEDFVQSNSSTTYEPLVVDGLLNDIMGPDRIAVDTMDLTTH